MPKTRWLWPIAISSLIWGLVLSGFFLYLPYVAELTGQKNNELTTIIGWILFAGVALLIGRHYQQLRFSKTGFRSLAFISILFATAGIFAFMTGLGVWSWILLSFAAALVLTAVISGLVYQSQADEVSVLSAWLGAAPLIGLLVISASFSLEVVRSNYSTLTFLVIVLSALQLLITKTPEQQASNAEPELKVSAGSLLSYGFALGLGVALVNSYVFARIAEIAGSGLEEVAQIGAILVFFASLAGVTASLITSLEFIKRISRVVLARIAGGVVALATLILIIANSIELAAVAGLLFGIGFGLANGIELRLVQGAALSAPRRTALFGAFLAATTLPYVVASVIGSQLSLLGLGTIPVLVFALVVTALGALVIRKPQA